MRNFRNVQSSKLRRVCSIALLGTAIHFSIPAMAQDQPKAEASDADASQDGDIIVTATKREESLQKVPISIQALGTETLSQHQVTSFDDYAKLLPSVSFQSFGPGQSQIFFRGVSSGGDGLHAGPSPTSGLYLDEIPVTTIAGSIDLHVYDIARVEALSGPQGTLFGASSLSGTLRLITNKPDPSKTEGGFDVQFNKFGKGDAGGVFEGFLNLPLSPTAALRLVGFYQRDGGYIDNILQTRTFTLGDNDPTTNLTVNNAALVGKDINDVETYGGRAALKIDLDDNWTISPTIIYQHQVTHGPFLFDPRKGDLVVTDFLPSRNKDRFYQAALTIQGKISDFDLVYSGGYFERKVNNASDYSYYTVAYDQLQGSSYTNFPDGKGGFLDPTENQILGDKYSKFTQETRISTPNDKPFRVVAGLFYQRQTDRIAADYVIKGIASIPTPPNLVPIIGFGDDVFLTRIFRTDRDYAAFAEASYDLTSTLKLTGGIRGFKAKNSLSGFSGFQRDTSPTGSAPCLPTTASDRPCDNVSKKTSEDGETHRLSLSWQITPRQLVYATYSTGFRPGGSNRKAGIVPFKSDRLSNYELGAKLNLFDRKLRINSAIFYEELSRLQFGLSPVGSAGVTNTYNAGNARIYGAESDFSFAFGALTLSGSGTYIDAKLTTDFCDFDPQGNSVCVPGVTPAAPKGTRLPVQPRFKGNLTARYAFPLGSTDGFVQGALNHQSSSRSALRPVDQAVLGSTREFSTFDFSVGTKFQSWTAEIFIQNAFDKRGQLSIAPQCAITICGPFARSLPIKPQVFGMKIGTRF